MVQMDRDWASASFVGEFIAGGKEIASAIRDFPPEWP